MPARSPGSANPALVLPLQGFLAGCIGRILCALLVCVAAPHGANAQEPVQTNPQSTQTEPSAAPAPDADSDSSSTDTLTLFPHSDTSRYWISGQANIILQWHPRVPGEIHGNKQPAARTRKWHLQGLYALSRLRAHTDHGSFSRHRKRGWPRPQQCARTCRHHESRRGAQHNSQPESLRRPADAAADHSAQR